MGLIKIGFDCTSDKLRSELLSHPERFFFILIKDDHAALCIQTCDVCGNDIRSHILGSIGIDSEGNGVSVFEDDLKAAALKQKGSIKGEVNDSEDYLISPTIQEKIRGRPEFISWIIHFLLMKKRSLILYPKWAL